VLELAGPGAPITCVVQINHLGGALARPPSVPNAVGHRDARYLLRLLSPVGGGGRDVVRAAHERVASALAPWIAGRSLNFMFGEDAGHVRAAFDPADYHRLTGSRRGTTPTICSASTTTSRPPNGAASSEGAPPWVDAAWLPGGRPWSHVHTGRIGDGEGESAMREGCVAWPAELEARYVARGYWQGVALGTLVGKAAAAYGEREALVDGAVRLSHRRLAALADLLAVRLRRQGLASGDAVVVQLPNRWEFVPLLLACLRLGVLPVMALPAHRERELRHLLEVAEAAAIVVPDRHRGFDHQALALRLAEAAQGLRIVVLGRAEPGHLDLGAILSATPRDLEPEAVAERGAALDASAPDPRDVALFLLSGGTTGLPKLIPRTHDDYAYNARLSARLAAVDETTTYLVTLPAAHNFPLACPGILGTLLLGGRVVMAPTPDPAVAFPLIEREGVTHTAVVPAVAHQWLDAAAATGPPGPRALRSLRVLQVGGARLAPEQARRVRPTLGAALQQVFGMAEGLLNFTRLDDPQRLVCETQGRPASPDDQVRIVDAEGKEVPQGETGALITQGPYTLRGYYRAPEHHRTAFTPEGWYRSGDLVRRVDGGNLVVEGREKDLINRGGEKVSAEEVEDLAYLHPGVALVAAVPAPDPVLGERVCVFVVPKPGAAVTCEELRRLMEAQGVARFKLPERLELVSSLPLTAVGKVDKRALRERARQTS
jgi:2,3-dihydroxybenzoate-AMP ligase